MEGSHGKLPPSEVANALYEAPASILDDKDWQSHYVLMTRKQWMDDMQSAAEHALNAPNAPNAPNALDRVQEIFDFAGMAPGPGEAFDAINAVIYFARGDIGNGLLSSGAIIPGAGNAVTAAKLSKKGLKYADEAAAIGKNAVKAGDVAKYADDVKDAVKQGDNLVDGIKGASKTSRNLIDDFDSIVDDVYSINKKYSDGSTYNSIESIVTSASYYDDPYEQIAAIGKSVSQHAFTNGNKRTAFDTMKMLLDDMNLSSPLSDSKMWDLIYDMSSKEGLTDVSKIALRLQGK